MVNTNRKYRIGELTPEAMRCIWGACSAIYEVIERTQESMKSIGGLGSPGVYEALRPRTPEEQNCAWGLCPDIQEKGNVYLIIGKLIDPKVAGLEKKVGEGEVLIEVPRDLIDKMVH